MRPPLIRLSPPPLVAIQRSPARVSRMPMAYGLDRPSWTLVVVKLPSASRTSPPPSVPTQRLPSRSSQKERDTS